MRTPHLNLLSCLFLLSTSEIGQSNELPKHYSSTRGLARGNALTADAHGLEGVYYNPATQSDENTESAIHEAYLISPRVTMSDEIVDYLMFQENPYKNFSVNPDLKASEISKKGLHFSAQNFSGFIMEDISLGFLSESHSNVILDIHLTDLRHSTALAELVTTHAMTMGSSWEVLDDLKIGFNLRPIFKHDRYYDESVFDLIMRYGESESFRVGDLLTENTGWGLGKDLGAYWNLPGELINISFGMAVFDLLDTDYRFGEGAPRKDLQQVNLGCAIKFFRDDHTFTGSFDIYDTFFHVKDTSAYQRLHFGLKWDYQKYGGLLVGINQGYTSFGAYVGQEFVGIELSRSGAEYGKYPGDIPSIRDSVQIRIGFLL